ncbi:MAG: NADP-dependent isocitrate dehydrogenase [Planctomycetota bacterium]
MDIEWRGKDGSSKILKKGLALKAGEIIDGTYLSKDKLVAFLDRELSDARAKGLLFSVHLKATMMKVSDPILFGHVVRRYFHEVFERHGAASSAPVPMRTTVWGHPEVHPDPARRRTRSDRAGDQAAYTTGPALAMVTLTAASPTCTCPPT